MTPVSVTAAQFHAEQMTRCRFGMFVHLITTGKSALTLNLLMCILEAVEVTSQDDLCRQTENPFLENNQGYSGHVNGTSETKVQWITY